MLLVLFKERVKFWKGAYMALDSGQDWKSNQSEVIDSNV